MGKGLNGIQAWTAAQKRTQLDIFLFGDVRRRLAIGMDGEGFPDITPMSGTKF
jgi:hypothetical protein